MLLTHQVSILRSNLPEIQKASIILPIHGRYAQTKQAYRFVHLVHPARDIMTTIHAADKSGCILPHHLRGWDIDVEYASGTNARIHLKKLLGMIIHMNYLNLQDTLDVKNDSNERIIVPRAAFVQMLKRLILSQEDICLVACARAEEECRRRSRRAQGTLDFSADAAGFRNFYHILWNISSTPELAQLLWRKYFSAQSQNLDDNSTVIDDIPVVKGGTSTRSRIEWLVGWRRNGQYSETWIEVVPLIATVRELTQEN